ncbi:MAG: hypothetical protein IH612_09815 [Desulfofustis sp.]|nr:hypothetical protein [Desulfofustis sp.]
MSTTDPDKQSRLIAVLREGIGLVQMIFFKEIKARLDQDRPDLEATLRSRLAGAVTNELFGTINPAPEFMQFHREHQALIEQELLGLAVTLPHLLPFLTDALRLQTLCDNQEGLTTDDTLITADKLGILVKGRQTPLPSAFMTMVRELGARYQLIIPPAPIAPEDDHPLVH